MRLSSTHRTTTGPRGLLPVGAAAAMLALVSACSSRGHPITGRSSAVTGVSAAAASSPSAAGSTVPATSTSTATATQVVGSAASTSAGASSGTSSTPAGASTGDCTNAQLAVHSAAASGGDSHGGIIVVFVNTSRKRCSLYGYPGAAATDRNGHQFIQARRTLTGYIAGCGCARPARIRLDPGRSASSVVEGDNGGGDECLRGHQALVTPPNTTRPSRVPYLDAYSCNLQVHPVVAGSSGGNRR